jgi:hypothetical protein
MNKIFSILIFFLFAIQVCAQTPKIMHERMGGTPQDFHSIMNNPNAAIRKSNFGLPPTIAVKGAVIDTIQRINDSTVVVTSSEGELHIGYYWLDVNFPEGSTCYDTLLKQALIYDSLSSWKPGKDTLINHPIFDARATPREIYRNLNKLIHSTEIMRNTVFIGFEGNKIKNNATPFLYILNKLKPQYLILFAGVLALLYRIALHRNTLTRIAFLSKSKSYALD